jgi:hypothetical protein
MNIRRFKKYFKSATGFFSSSEEARANDYDAFDYVNGDFDRVIAGSTKAAVATTTAPSFATTMFAGTGSTVQLPATSRGNPVTPVGISPASSSFSPTAGDQSKPDSSLHIERKDGNPSCRFLTVRIRFSIMKDITLGLFKNRLLIQD